MKIRRFSLDMAGSAHIILPLLVIVGVGIIGSYIAVKSRSHADVIMSNMMAVDRARGVQDKVQQSSDYTGVSIGDDGKINVYSKNPTPQFKAQTIGSDASSNYVFHQTKHSLQDLTQTHDRINQDANYLNTQGIKLVSVFPDPISDGVNVQVESLNAPQVKLLQQRYGADVHVSTAKRKMALDSRLSDSAPWNDGDIISDVIVSSDGSRYWTSCTAGPTVKNSAGVPLLMSAGHCFFDQTNTQATLGTYHFMTWQKNAEPGAPVGTNSASIGYAAAQFTEGGPDVALIYTKASGKIWRTQTLTQVATTGTKQIGAQYSVLGESLCLSGAYSGERCGAKVTSVNGTMYTCDHYNRCFPHPHMSEARNPSSQIMGGGGDSGSAVYSVRPTGLMLKGMMVAGPNNQDCPQYNSIRPGSCSDTMDYEEIIPLMQATHTYIYNP